MGTENKFGFPFKTCFGVAGHPIGVKEETMRRGPDYEKK
jgi:hypothetical protein